MQAGGSLAAFPPGFGGAVLDSHGAQSLHDPVVLQIDLNTNYYLYDGASVSRPRMRTLGLDLLGHHSGARAQLPGTPRQTPHYHSGKRAAAS